MERLSRANPLDWQVSSGGSKLAISKRPSLATAGAALLPLALAALSLSGAALTVTIGGPTAGTWTASSSIDVNGTAGAPNPDRAVLDFTGDFAGGTEINVTTSGDRVSLAIPTAEVYRYSQNFTGMVGSASIDRHWMWNLTGTAWEVLDDASLAAFPPSLGHSGTTSEHIFWNTLLPGAVYEGIVGFSWACQANAQIDVWASSGGAPNNETSIFNYSGTGASAFSYNFTALLSGATSLYFHFRVGASSLTSSFCSVDDFAVVATVDTSQAARTQSFNDSFSAGVRAVWNTYEGNWAHGSPSGVSDSPPALYHGGTATTSVWANWASATPIISAALSFHYQCEANGALQAYLSTDGLTETRILSGPRGANHTAFVYNATSLLAGSSAAFLRIASDSTSASANLCGFDDVFFNGSVTGFLYAPYSGAYTSPPIDLGGDADLTTADWVATVPPVSSLAVSFRSSANGVAYSSWAAVPSSGSSVAASGVRFVQFRLDFVSAGLRAVPSVDRIAVNYSALARVEVSVNGGPWAVATGTAAWTANVALAGGSNNITARVTDSTGATTQSVVQVWRDTFPPGLPGKPAGPAVTNLSEATWSWTAASDFGLGVDHYLVDVGLTPGGAELGGGFQTSSLSFTRTGLPDNVRVFATVWAVDLAGLVSELGATSDGTLVDRTAPGAASIAAAPAFTQNDSITWTWSAAPEVGAGVASYMVRVGSTAGGSDAATATTAALTYTFTGGVSGSSYHFSVAAVDLAGNVGAFASAPSVTVDQAPPSAPSAVTAPGAVTNSTALTWSWGASTDALSGVDHYRVFLGTSAGASNVDSSSWAGTSYTAASVSPGARYYFEVRAVDRAGNVGPAAIAAAVLIDVEAPSAPIADTVSSYVAQATLAVTWNASVDGPAANASGIDHYLVRVSDGTSVEVTAVSGLEAAVPLTDGVHYTVSISGVDLAGNEGPTSSISFTSDRSGPLAPNGLKVVILQPDGPTLQASWNGTSDTGSGVKEYRISIGTTPGGTDVANGRIVTGTNERWTGTFGTTYFVTVWAVDNLGNAGASSATTEGVTPQRPGAGGGGLLPGPGAAAALAAVFAASAIVAVRRRK